MGGIVPPSSLTLDETGSLHKAYVYEEFICKKIS